jgi:serine/threonine protein kinase
LLKFSPDINLIRPRRIGPFRLTEKILLAGIQSRPIEPRDPGVEGRSPAIRVRGPVPPAGLFKASAAFSSPISGVPFPGLRSRQSAKSPHAWDLVWRVLDRNPDQRLGRGDCDFNDIQTHPFFVFLNWTKVLNGEITQERVPQLRTATDVSILDQEFTSQAICGHEDVGIVGSSAQSVPGTHLRQPIETMNEQFQIGRTVCEGRSCLECNKSDPRAAPIRNPATRDGVTENLNIV